MVAMRVLYDGAVFQNADQRGIQRLFFELIEHLPLEAEATLFLPGPARYTLPGRARVVVPALGIPNFLPKKLSRRVAKVIARSNLARLAASHAVFDSTYYTLPPNPRIPTVLHVYDMIVERFVDHFHSRWAEEEIARKRHCIERATHIIAISHATARELELFYPQTRDRITPIYPGCDHVSSPLPLRSPDAGSYALFVGDRHGYKNFRSVLDAMEASAWPSELVLVVVGPPWRPNEELRVGLLSRERTIRHEGLASDEELARLYAGAACVIIPSLAEGFGFPVLEAQTAGVPVVCSDVEVFREVAGDGALFFDPHRPDELAARVSSACDPDARSRLTAAGARNAERFSWVECAARTVDLYRRVAT
jgi:glycosyltransferase involved in cell wall biosynthesis